MKIQYNKLFRNPIKYYKVFKRKERIRLIRFYRTYEECVSGMWIKQRNCEKPLYKLHIE